MSDLISRKATLAEIVAYEIDSTVPIDYRKIVREMPSAERKGHWIPMFGHNICDMCGCKIGVIPTNYCPNCGAKMR